MTTVDGPTPAPADASAQETAQPAWHDRWVSAVDRARRRLQSLSHQDRLSIARHDFAAVADRGVVAFDYADGPNGVRGHDGATAFPSMLALAASFDRDLAADYGITLAQETLAAGRNAIFSPGLDITRVPWGGRAGQQLGEDPFLVGELGGITGRAVQSQGVLAVATHYVANNFEWLRTGEGSMPHRTPAIDVHIGDRALHQIYLEPFRRALLTHGVAAIMGSYNRVNGEYVCQSAHLLSLLRHWGWGGVTVPDAVFAVRDPRAALVAGLDLPALGDAGGRTEDDLQQIAPDKLDQIVLHVLAAAEQANLVPAPAPADEPPPGSAAVARRIVQDGMVLLANDGALPLPPTGRIALIDAAHVRSVLVMGGAPSVTLTDERITSVADALGHALGTPGRLAVLEVGHGEVPLSPMILGPSVAALSAVVRDDITGQEHRIALDRAELNAPAGVGPDWSASLHATVRAHQAGPYTLTFEFAGTATVHADDVQVTAGFREASPMLAGPQYPLHAVLELAQGQSVDIRVDYATSVAISIPGTSIRPHLRIGLAVPDGAAQRAADLAAACDVAIVLAGRLSGEAMDVESLALPGPQAAVVSAVAAANPRTVLVTLGAGPILPPPDAPFAALLHTWFPGEQFGPALADVLTGRAEPGGRLPITFPATEDSTPIKRPEQYPGLDGVVSYSEGLLVGYRWYDEHQASPAYPFGHGLGYTTFQIDRIDHRPTSTGWLIEVHVRNTGPRRGKAVPQLYVRYPTEAEQPPAQLKGFAALRVPAGATQVASIPLDRDDLALYDPNTGERAVVPGRYEVRAGLSSRDIHRTCVLAVPQPGSTDA